MNNSDTPEFMEEKNQTKISTPLKNDDCNIQYKSVQPTEDNVKLIDDDTKDEGKSIKLCAVVRKLTIEPVVFCYMVALFMNSACMSNMMMEKGCLNHFNYSTVVCKNLSDPEYKDIKDKVEILGTNFTLYLKCMTVLAAFSMVFIAPWSDKYSRKIPLLLTLFGSMLTDIGYLLCSIYFELRNEYLLLADIPSEICGGYICALMIFYSHASEVSSERFRTIKYAIVEAAFGLGMCLGGLAGGLLYRYYGYPAIYEVTAALHVFCFLWVVFVVEETAGLDANVGCWQKIKDIFVFDNVKGGIKAAFRRRDGYQRSVLLLLIASMCIIALTYESFSSFGFTFVHHIYDWDPTTFNFVVTASSLLQMPLSIILVPVLIRRFKITDFTFGTIGTVSMITKNIIISFAIYHTFIYYLGSFIGAATGLAILAIRTAISKLAEKDEIGRVFSFLATCEATLPIVGNIGITSIFTATLNTTPNIAYLTSAITMLLPLFTFLWSPKVIGRTHLVVPIISQVQEKVQDA